MGKKICWYWKRYGDKTFGDIEIEKNKFYCHESPII